MGWIVAIVAAIGGVTFFARGAYLIFFADEYVCAQVSIEFTRIASRMGTIGLDCLPPTSSGAIPSWLGGWGAMLFGSLLLVVALFAAAFAADR